MRNVYKKIIAIALVAAIGSTFGACGKKDKNKDSNSNNSANNSASDESITVDSIDAEQASAALKQDLTVTLDDQDSQEAENGQDATEGDGSSDGSSSNGGSSNNGSADGDVQYVEVTNDKGEVQTDADGNAETKSVSNNAGSGNGNASANENGGSVSDPDYVSKTTVAKTYWLDMTKSDNYVFDGEFLVATFKVKDSTPDGSYPIDITKADIANWEAETLTPDIINGYVTVGDAQAPSTDSATDGNFTFSVDSVKAKAGDTIEVKFKVSSNPGLVAFVFNFSFDSNALEYQGLSVGKDAEDIITLSE